MSRSPIKMWIDGKSFSIQKLVNNFKTINKSASKDETNYDITIAENGEHQSSFQLPKYYLQALTVYDTKGVSLTEIQKQTSTKIVVPVHDGDDNITVIGDNKISVTTACQILHSILGELRERHIALQFISLPIKSVNVQNNFELFKAEILAQNLEGIDESIFMKTKRLHLTIACLALLSDSEKLEAAKILEECKTNIISPIIDKIGTLKVNISGVYCMSNKPAKEHILYGCVQLLDESKCHSLQAIADNVSKHFYEKGFVRRYQENVKIHMTLINTKYRKSTGSKRKRSKWYKDSFDARPILEKYKDFNFGENEIHCIDLCLMQCDDSGRYKIMNSITF